MMHIFSAKSKTKKEKITDLKDAPVFYIPMLQNIGTPATPIVKVGDTIKRFQLIGEATGHCSANIHSPISGVVIDICPHPLADGTVVETIIVENDYLNTEIMLGAEKDVDLKKMSSEEILSAIKDCGIVGEGGAQFPTHNKYDIKDKEIDTFIINGTECEPFLTADYALMNEFPNLLFTGIKMINKVLKAKEVVITVEAQNKDIMDSFNYLMNKPEYSNYKVMIFPDKYPQGGELQLIKSVTGKELGKGKLPSSIGLIVSNVGTVIAVYKAIVNRKPLVERVVTVSGDFLQGAGNYNIKIGTPVQHIIKELKLDSDIENKGIVLGGPMMGKAVSSMLAPVTKGSSGVLTFKKKEVSRNNCIMCGYCADVCPMHLMPMKFEQLFRRGKYSSLAGFSISECIECAACEYICPSNVSLMESIKEGKSQLKNLK
ncbi:electron transport complex subunit RsxC [Dysgonomonas sp. 520]|uniref:electron transport complex subunit RsxC n=1 Tax=Dysgonomonas sp. 520 TaxID=2302931 RepID=UPI0013D33E05|nr:electron transport complex subunit RsxC [Dysgonomonas sp. 520]NDW08939.1 electron transport complex subunit RsxC [Dysgonomonas sp. 520]